MHKTRAPKYMKRILTGQKGETDSATVVVEDFDTSYSIIDRTNRRLVRKQMTWTKLYID